jgi:hypothetical protein
MSESSEATPSDPASEPVEKVSTKSVAKDAPNADDPLRLTVPLERNANRNGLICIVMLIVIAIVMFANAVGWVDPDL